MEEQKQYRVSYPNRKQVKTVYANNFNVVFNPYEFTLEFALIDGPAANFDIQAGKSEVEAEIVARVAMSPQAMAEFIAGANQLLSEYQKGQAGKQNG